MTRYAVAQQRGANGTAELTKRRIRAGCQYPVYLGHRRNDIKACFTSMPAVFFRFVNRVTLPPLDPNIQSIGSVHMAKIHLGEQMV